MIGCSPVRRHVFRVPLAAWDESLRLRFELMFCPGARESRYGRTDGTAYVQRLAIPRRVHWTREGDHMVTATAKGGAAVAHLRVVARRWGPGGAEDRAALGVDIDEPVQIAEADDVRCPSCVRWTDADCEVCAHCDVDMRRWARRPVKKSADPA